MSKEKMYALVQTTINVDGKRQSIIPRYSFEDSADLAMASEIAKNVNSWSRAAHAASLTLSSDWTSVGTSTEYDDEEPATERDPFPAGSV